MRKIACAIIVLAVTITATGKVTITIDGAGKGELTIGYDCNEGKVIGSFSLDVDVNDSVFAADLLETFVDSNTPDNYVYPGSITFSVIDGNIVIDEFGTLIAEQDASGGVLEAASLYSDGDPCYSQLVSLHFDCNYVPVVVTVSSSAERGDIVLEDPNEGDCLVVDANIGGVWITQEMYELWVELGKPECWCYPCHRRGDVNGDGQVNFGDALGTDGVGPPIYDGWIDSIQTKYHPCSDIDNDGVVSFGDAMGCDGTGGPIWDGWIDGIDIQCPPYP